MISYLQDFFMHIVVMTPPPVQDEKRLAWQTQRFEGNAKITMDRSVELSGKYSKLAVEVVKTINSDYPEKPPVHCLDVWQLMLAHSEDEWSNFLLDDGLHLSPAGNDFVASQLISLLEREVAARESLPYELPWGFEIPPEHYKQAMIEHQKKQLNNRIGLGKAFDHHIPGGQTSKLYYPSNVFTVSTLILLCIGALISFINYFHIFKTRSGISKDT